MSLFAVIVLAVVAAACVAALRWPFAGLLAYLWLDFMRVHEMDAQVHRLRPMLLVGALTLGSAVWRQRDRVLRLDALSPAMIALALTVALSGNWRADPATAGAAVVQIAKLLALVWLIRVLVTTRDRLHLVLALIALSLSVHAVGAVRQGIEHGLIWEFRPALAVRGPGADFAGGWTDNNDLARILVVGLPLCWALATWPQGGWARVPAAAGALVTCMGIVFTYSRGGFLAFCVAVAALAVGRWSIGRGLAIAAGIIAAILALAPAPYRERVATLGHAASDSSVQGRVGAWRHAVGMVQERPLSGHGVGSLRVPVGEGANLRMRTSHNVYLELAAEVGILGLVAYLWMLIGSLAVLLSVHRQGDCRSWPRVSGDGLLAAILAYSAASLALSNPFQSPVFVLIGLAGALGTIASAEPRGIPRDVSRG